MKPIQFDEQNITFVGPKGGNIGNLHVYQDRTGITSCWKLSWLDLLSAIIFRKIWLNVAGSKLPPMKMLCMNTVFPRCVWLIRCRHCTGNGFVPGRRIYKENGMNMVPKCPRCDATGLNLMGRFMVAHPAFAWSTWKWILLGSTIGMVMASMAVA